MPRAFVILLLVVLACGSAQAQSDDLLVIGCNPGSIARITPTGVTPYSQINEVSGLGAVGFAVDARGFLYVAAPDLANSSGTRHDAIYRVDKAGNSTVFARGFKQLAMLAIAANGTLLAGTDSVIYKISPAGTVTPLPTKITGPTGMAFDANGTLFVSNVADGTIVKLNVDTGAVTPFATGIDHPEGLAFDSRGNLFVADIYKNQVLRVSSLGIATPVAQVPLARSLAFGPQGELYITSESANAVFRLDKTGNLSPFFNGLSKPLNLAFNHPLIKPVAVAIAPAPTFSVGLMIACIIPALILIVALLVWLLFREKRNEAARTQNQED